MYTRQRPTHLAIRKHLAIVSFLTFLSLSGCSGVKDKTENNGNGPEDSLDSGTGEETGSGGQDEMAGGSGGETAGVAGGGISGGGAGVSGMSAAGGSKATGGRGGKGGSGGSKDAGAQKPEDNSCCVAHPGFAGCDDKSVQDCVCGHGDPDAGVPECCTNSPGWDSICVLMVGPMGCGVCKSDCCTASTTSAGCLANSKIEKCVCAADTKCCGADGGVWDVICVAEAKTNCGAICN